MVCRPILQRTRPLVALGLYAIALGISACDGRQASPSPSPSARTTASPSIETAFVLTSSALSSGSWPSADTCDGGDGVPDLHWTAGPAGTGSYALAALRRRRAEWRLHALDAGERTAQPPRTDTRHRCEWEKRLWSRGLRRTVPTQGQYASLRLYGVRRQS